MNENNAAQPGLTDDDILQVFSDVVGNQEDDARFIDVDRDQAIRIARTLLSKLRAPVAGEAQPEQGDPASPKDDSDRTYDRPIGYLAAYELGRLHSGHSANLRSAKFGPSALDGDVPVYLDPPNGDAAPQASAEDERGHADGWAAGWDQAIKQPQADKDSGQWEPQTPEQIAADMRNMARSEGFDWPEPDGSQQLRWRVTDDMRYAVSFAPSSAHWSERLKEFFGPDAREGIDALERQLREARAMLDRQPKLPGGWQLALNLAIDAIENAAPMDWPVNWPAILHGLKELRAALSAPQAEQGEREDG